MTGPLGWCRSHADVVIAVVLSVTAVVMLVVDSRLRHPGAVPEWICVIASCGMVAWRRRYPVAVAVAAGICIAVPFQSPYADAINDSALFLPVFIAIFLYSYTLGAERPWTRAWPGVVALITGANLSGGAFNPLPEMLIIGPWVAGMVVASRRRTIEQLALRAGELEAEREIFAVLSVRYERARIARELHDIVAHCVSLIVVQANAGARLTRTDPASAAEAFGSIGDAARQADEEIDRLVELLNTSTPTMAPAGLRIVEELVRRARASGLHIACEFSGECDSLCEASADAAYRLVQEGVTNAVKHAPGAPITVSVSGHDRDIALEVINGVTSQPPSGLEQTGGGRGLAGMRERVARCGGCFEAGPVTTGGWHIAATLPRQVGSPLMTPTSVPDCAPVAAG